MQGQREMVKVEVLSKAGIRTKGSFVKQGEKCELSKKDAEVLEKKKIIKIIKE